MQLLYLFGILCYNSILNKKSTVGGYMSNLSNISTIKNILSKYGFSFSKSLGQNFLINPSVCPKMAEYCTSNPEGGVIEIGPGIGVLTYELAKRAKKVVAIELDKRLLPVLDDTLGEFDNVKVINGDVLKMDINKIIDDEFAGMSVSICANLPYYITSPIIMKLLEENVNIESLTVMVQKEAADRICALPGSRNSGAISLAVNYYSEPRILFQVSKGSFMPAPKVDSSVIKLNIRKNPPVNVENRDLLFKVIKAGFSQRRKTLVNCLSSSFGLEKSALVPVLEKGGLNPSIRAEALTLQDFAFICNELDKVI